MAVTGLLPSNWSGERINKDWMCTGDEDNLFECAENDNTGSLQCNNTRAVAHCFGESALSK